jgi:proteic killer suppression protein
MIKRIRHKGLRRLYSQGDMSGVQSSHVPRLRALMALLEAAATPNDLAARSLRLHELKGRRAGTWSLWVNGNWRLTFRFVGEDVTDVGYEDYH